MSTEQTDLTGAALWLPMADLARQRNITRQSLAERIARLEKGGLTVTRRDGRKRLVDVAAFDMAVGQTGDAFKEQSAETKREEPTNTNPKLRDAQADKANYEARLKALDYGERTGQLVPRRGDKGVETAVIRISDDLLRAFGAPLDWVSDLMDAAHKGEPELRRVLRGKIRENREKAANILLRLAGAAEADDADGVQIDIDFED